MIRQKSMFGWLLILLAVVTLTIWLGFINPALLFGEPAGNPENSGGEATVVSPEPAPSSSPSAGDGSPEPVKMPATLAVSFDEAHFTPEVLMENLEIPWEIVYLPEEDDWLLTQRGGQVISMRHGTVGVVDEVSHSGEGGLLGMALHPDFDDNGYLYLYFTATSENRLINRVMRYRYEHLALNDPTLVIDNIPGARTHNGGRIAFGPDGMLYVTTGDAQNPSLSQDLESLAGKILRLTPEGTVPQDNPFPGSYVYSLGHRNPQGLAWHPETGELYASEHGPSRMDEINLILPGRNYGWPLVTCGDAPTNFEDPVACYDTFTLAPSGMSFYTGEGVAGTPLLVAGLRGNRVQRIDLDAEGLVISQEDLFTQWGRLRGIRVMQGDLYFFTNNRDGRGSPHQQDDRLIRLRLQLP
ncbi:PQQ-dependent sugar dehydrogenase [Anoxynatronum buryatiense]|uniref:Glucose/arabinose dehydrogenase, beta-propeller fold n=1 Tax=Anoxynatronum buryatiense TaxID=489973 RepID=A0AA45WVF2_9CLOT|nr:PQQ-dependent sugar dehydrogenase [Anoxynatronum buryatiense]SMP53662.1 Glucose/arabinose dehydrogenase, beta-propeller fold [Anoxynatronum buryatiense]